MSVIKDMGRVGRSLPCAAEAIVEGYVYKYTADGYMTIITAKGDSAFAVALASSLDPQLATAKTLTAGDNWSFAELGCKMIVTVASIASRTWTGHPMVYLADLVDGMVDTAHATSRPIGHYAGPSGLVTSSSDGDLIEVYLDVQPGADNVA
jgi:hypothetical protein